jgi:hypothetical protein
MNDTKQGLTAAIEALGAGEVLPAEAGQPDLFEEAEAPLPIPPAARSGPKGGRPRGSRNKRTEEWVDYLLGRYRSPLVFLLETYSRTPAQLAEQMQLYKFHEGKLVTDANGQPVLATGEAADIQVKAAIAVLPYLHQRLPQAIEVKPNTRGLLLIGDLAGDGASDALAIPFAEVQENQSLSDLDAGKSDGANSRTEASALIYNEESANGQ